MPAASLPRTAKAVAAHADATLAALAFPPTQQRLVDASEAAGQLARILRGLPAVQRTQLDDSGLDGTVTRHSFDLGIAEWLVAEFPDDVEIDWSAPTASTAVETLLQPALLRGEEEGFASDALSMRAWVQAARGGHWSSDLAWLLDALRSNGDSLARRDAVWSAAELPIRWRLRHAGLLHARLDVPRVRIRRSMRRPGKRVLQAIATADPPIRLLSGDEARRVIHVSRETLAARCREVHAISHANPDEVWLGDLGQGTCIAVIGVRQELRLPLEANYGFVLFANGVPVGYGGVTPLFRQANTGINIFPAFRGSEAASLWTGALGCFRALFGSSWFIANPYQIGGGNSEAIKSGAFWFYHRLGFRPTDAALEALADAEATARRADPSHRSSAATLRRLAGADLVLRLPGARAEDRFDERWLAPLSLRHSAQIAATGLRDRRAAEARLATRLAQILGVSRDGWHDAERAAFASLAPLMTAIPDLASWGARDRRALAALLRAKGGPQERDYARRAAAHPRLLAALSALVR